MALHPFMGIDNWDRVGLSVEQSAARLHRIGYLDRQCMRIQAGHMPARPEYEVKGALARGVYRDSVHCDQLRARCRQLRMSVVAFDKSPDPELDKLMDAALGSDSTLKLLTALYAVVKPAQIEAIRRYMSEAQPLVDEPTIHLLQHQLIDREEQVRWGAEAIRELAAAADESERAAAARWEEALRAQLAAAGGVDGMEPRRPVPPELAPRYEPFRLPERAARDERFTSSPIKFSGMSFEDSDAGRLRTMMYHRFFEMSPAEAVAVVHFASEGKPWAFYCDTARHLWDEVRHAWFGEAALRLTGENIYETPNWTGWHDMHRELFTLEELYTHLTIAIEKAGMKYPPGKREEWEFCRDTMKHPLMTTFQDFDWADEVVHAGFGQRWVVEELFGGDAVKAAAAADKTVCMRQSYMEELKERLYGGEAAAAGEPGDPACFGADDAAANGRSDHPGSGNSGRRPAKPHDRFAGGY